MNIMSGRLQTLFLLTCFSLFSCNRDNSADCFKKTGAITTREFALAPFHTIVVIDEADIYLENGTDQQVEIKAGKNLIPEIHFEVEDSILTITNDNRCNWVRTPGNPGIYIRNNQLRKIEIYDFVNFYSPDTLHLNQLQIYSDGTGNFDMMLDVNSLQIESMYISNYKLTGRVQKLEIIFKDDSRLDGKALVSEFNFIQHEGSNLIELFPIKELTGEISSTGDLCYYHVPDFMDVEIKYTGKLIDCSRE
jgi:hypothetical protein